ncbi:MAG: hypothetical protein NUV46_04700 [Nanoarchaeota archaeon]|nr:hypothetical protein [Nanoarchaeota archaeon]
MSIETMNYINALKSRKLRDVKVASFDRQDFIKKQDNKCSKCKKDLRPGYYKINVDPKTKEKSAICSDCLITIPERR